MKTISKFKLPILILLIFIALVIFVPNMARNSIIVTLDYLKEMALILPPIFMLMGLIEVWISKDKIQRWIGSESGIKGMAVSMALGTLPTGPLYVAFPMASSLLGKGASVRNIVIFLGSWAALKIPLLVMEIKFLGISFASLRFAITLVILILMGLLIEFILLRLKPDKEWLEASNEE